MKNYYYLLGIANNANPEEIKKAYKQLALKFHPDKNNGDKFFEERFKDIQEAHEVLSNATQRAV
ncbi:curved DNA-binding protein [Flexibacter flexilis DSM 6793]|uniref:Curved DNA-binding protein n=1 Tax=Flexibacter flexilis DSM 6793 TaxID=927664 RepID=A0A1I1I2G6_9BACT|nr:DnaJ domain-containing protein [Flexibacter flexilis]SFC30346.1 curved DNA-binding protein [Flexibacter flexilis DSM 6793]